MIDIGFGNSWKMAIVLAWSVLNWVRNSNAYIFRSHSNWDLWHGLTMKCNDGCGAPRGRVPQWSRVELQLLIEQRKNISQLSFSIEQQYDLPLAAAREYSDSLQEPLPLTFPEFLAKQTPWDYQQTPCTWPKTIRRYPLIKQGMSKEQHLRFRPLTRWQRVIAHPRLKYRRGLTRTKFFWNRQIHQTPSVFLEDFRSFTIRASGMQSRKIKLVYQLVGHRECRIHCSQCPENSSFGERPLPRSKFENETGDSKMIWSDGREVGITIGGLLIVDCLEIVYS